MSDLITPVATLSFPNLFTPSKPKDSPAAQEEKYSCQLIIANTEDVSAIQQEIMRVAHEKFGDTLPKNLRMPLQRGEVKNPDEPMYAGKWLMNASSQLAYPPQVVNAQRKPIIDKNEVYAGCKVMAAVRFYAYDKAGNKGVACGLSAVMKVGDGDRLDSRKEASVLFAAVPLPKGAPAAPATNFAPVNEDTAPEGGYQW